MKIYVMSGAPASGKSTWAKAHLRNNTIYLSRDEWRDYERAKAHCDTYFPMSAKKETKTWYEYLKAHLKIAQQDNMDLVIDQTTLTNMNLMSLLVDLGVLNSPEYEIIVHRMDSTLEDCLARNANRTGWNRTPEDALTQLYEIYAKWKVHETPDMTNVKVVTHNVKVKKEDANL